MSFKILNDKAYRAILAQVARDHNISPQEMEREMKQAIDEAWSTTAPLAKTRQNILFKELGRKPTVKEFISIMADHVR